MAVCWDRVGRVNGERGAKRALSVEWSAWPGDCLRWRSDWESSPVIGCPVASGK